MNHSSIQFGLFDEPGAAAEWLAESVAVSNELHCRGAARLVGASTGNWWNSATTVAFAGIAPDVGWWQKEVRAPGSQEPAPPRLPI